MFQVTLSDGTKLYLSNLACPEGVTCTNGQVTQGGLYDGKAVITLVTYPENAELAEAFGVGFALILTAYLVGWAVGRILKAVETF